MVGHEGHELINIFALAIRFRITARQLREHVYAYPTFSADIKQCSGTGEDRIARRYEHQSQRAFPCALDIHDGVTQAASIHRDAVHHRGETRCSD
jgi:hypothetical protein